MLNCAIKYRILGNRLRKLGIGNMEVDEPTNKYHQELVGCIQSHLELERYIDKTLRLLNHQMNHVITLFLTGTLNNSDRFSHHYFSDKLLQVE